MVESAKERVCLAKIQVNEESKEKMNKLNRKKKNDGNELMPQEKNLSFKGRGKGCTC